jgi:fructose-specific PTS system IIA-like component
MGAEGVGLFRTEMLFMDREAPPSEEEQAEVYSQAVRAAQGRPVIIRLLDIGGDKPLPYLALPAEENPFLGWRAVRLYPAFEALVRTQIRAVLRASCEGPVRLMVPMVCCLEELRYVKALATEAAAELKLDPVPVGMMLEVPSAALILDQLCREADFFSLGTNDLAQYFLAVDRGNPKVANLYSPLHPAFLRFLDRIVSEIHAQGRWVGLCGEMGGQLRLLPLLLGLGLDELSVSAPAIPALKRRLAQLDGPRCRALLETAMAQE